MKQIFIGTLKACLYIARLLLVYWLINGFEMLTLIDVVGVLSVGAILKHFIDREEDKQIK